MDSLKMLRVHKKSCKFVLVKLKTEQDTETDIVDSALHCSVMRLRVVCIIVLGTRWVKLQIAFFMIRFLKQNICSDSCILQFSVIFHSCCGDVYVYPAYCTVFVVYAVNSVDAFKNVFYGIVYGVLSRFNC